MPRSCFQLPLVEVRFISGSIGDRDFRETATMALGNSFKSFDYETAPTIYGIN